MATMGGYPIAATTRTTHADPGQRTPRTPLARGATAVVILACAATLVGGGLWTHARAPDHRQDTAPGAPAIQPARQPADPGDTDARHRAVVPTGHAPTTPGPWLGTCRAGSSECLPDEDDLALP